MGMRARYWMGAKEAASQQGGGKCFSLTARGKDPHMMYRTVRTSAKQASRARRVSSHLRAR